MAIDNNQILLGKILGEIYRLQKNQDVPCGAEEARIYGLLNGFESVIEEELESIGFVSKEQLSHTVKVLNEIWNDPEEMGSFKGFYDIENDLQRGDVDRSTAMRVLTYLDANNSFSDLISKMDSSDSPSECRTFTLDKWSK